MTETIKSYIKIGLLMLIIFLIGSWAIHNIPFLGNILGVEKVERVNPLDDPEVKKIIAHSDSLEKLIPAIVKTRDSALVANDFIKGNIQQIQPRFKKTNEDYESKTPAEKEKVTYINLDRMRKEKEANR